MTRIAVIGLGVMGKNHYRVLKSLPDVEVAAVCDPGVEGFDEPHYKDVDSMLENEELDAAIIAVPTNLHKEVALKCMDFGLALLIEKPVAPTVAEGMEILSVAKAKGVATAVGHVERFNPVVAALKKELKSKEILTISITRVGPYPPRIADVGVITDLAVHDIDLIRFITEKEITEVNIYKSKKIVDHYEDNAVLSFKLEDDIVANITTNWITPFKKRTIEIATNDAYYEANLIGQELVEYSAFKTNNSYVIRDCFVMKSEPLVNELKAFVEHVNGREAEYITSLEDGVEILKIIEGR